MATALSALALSACASSDGGSGDEAITLTFLNCHPGFYDEAIARFTADHPNITVSQETVPFNDLASQIQARLGSQDSSLDIVEGDTPRIPAMVDSGFLADVSDDRAILEKAVTASAIQSVTVDDKLWAYPLTTSDGILFYHKAVLAGIGVPDPAATGDGRLTCEEVIDIGSQAQAAGLVDYAFNIYQIDRYYQLQPLLMSMGAGPGLEGDGNLTPAVDTPEWIQFGEWYRSIHDEGLAPRGIAPEQMTDIFANGDSAFYLASSGQIRQIQEGAIKDQWGVAPFPYFDDGDIATPTDAWSLAVSAYSPHQEAARELLRYLTTDTEGATLATSVAGSFSPVATEALPRWIELLDDVVPEGVAAQVEQLLTDELEYAVHRPSSIGYVQFETVINKAFSDIRNGGDPAEVLGAAQEQLELQLGRL